MISFRLAVAACVVALGISGAVSPASASVPVPLPVALSGHPFVTVKTAPQLRAWGPGANDPGNCVADTRDILGDQANITLTTSGATGNCTDVESPHTYPTTTGYVYEARIYFSNFYQWVAYWMYGNLWPADGETDAVEANFNQNCFSYHYGTTSDPLYTSTCYSAGITPESANIKPGWHTVDIAYGDHSVSVYYDGRLYATATKGVVNDPSWIVFSTGSCNAEGNNECVTGGQLAGYTEVQWLRIFR